jgi:hypothetical protein
MRILTILGLLFAQGSGLAPFDVPSMVVAPPTTVAEIDRKVLHGEPSQLSWSPDALTMTVLRSGQTWTFV